MLWRFSNERFQTLCALVSTCLCPSACYISRTGERILAERFTAEFYYSLPTHVPTPYMKTCPHIERNLLDIFWNENCSDKSCRDEWNTVPVRYPLFRGNTANMPNCYYAYFLLVKQYLFSVLGKISWEEFKYTTASIANESLIETVQFLANSA